MKFGIFTTNPGDFYPLLYGCGCTQQHLVIIPTRDSISAWQMYSSISDKTALVFLSPRGSSDIWNARIGNSLDISDRELHTLSACHGGI